MIALVDMDGVLVDLVGGALKLFNIEQTVEQFCANHLGDWHIDVRCGVPKHRFYESMTEEFWINLDWMPDGKEILRIVESTFGVENVYLWTSPISTDGCYDGKKKWVLRNMPTQYHRSGRLVVGAAKFLGACSKKILIDDSDHNIEAFREAGGHVCLVPRLWNVEHSVRHQATDIVMARLHERVQWQSS